VRRAAVLGGVLALLIPACTSAQARIRPPQAGKDILLTTKDFGRTIVVHVGQIVRIDLPDWNLGYFPSSVLQTLASQSATGPKTFRAVAVGSERVFAVQPPPPVSCPVAGYCMLQAARYGGFVIVALPANASFNLVVSWMDNGKLFLLAPGEQIIVAIPTADLTVADPAVLMLTSLRVGASLSVVSARRPGQSRVAGAGSSFGFSFDVLVRPANQRYDLVLTEKDAGRTIYLRVGQTVDFQLSNSPGYLGWNQPFGTWFQPIVDPAMPTGNDVANFGYLIEAAIDSSSPVFTEFPRCGLQANCRLVARSIQFSIAAS